ncbi:MAG: translocation/assembly module TamB domain-containing protein [Bacteroidales bacterium]
MLFLQNKQIQTAAAEYLTDNLSEKIEGEVSVSSVHYSFFKRLQLYDLYIGDVLGDTLIYAEVCNIRFKKFRPDKKDILIKKLSFENAMLQIIVDENKVNTLKRFIDSFRKDIPPEEKTVVQIEKIDFIHSRFRRINNHIAHRPSGINFHDLHLYDIGINIEDFLIKHDTTSLTVVSASGLEESGFALKEVAFDLSLSKTFMTFSQGQIITPQSKITPPLVDFRFNHPKNFKQVYDSVDLTIDTENSLLDFNDIAYFFPVVNDLNGMIRLNGNLSGRVGDLLGKDLLIDYLNETHLEFDMRLAGLPSTDSLFMDFDFQRVQSTHSDIKELTTYYQNGVNNVIQNTAGLEEIGYQGIFRGYKTDFVTAGLITTNLGNINIDMNMKPDSSGTIIFQGGAGSDGFNIGKMVAQETDVGNIVFSIDFDGEKSEGNVESSVSAMIDTLGIYGYDYSKIQLEGDFENRKFDGSFEIKDPNIDLMFAGTIDLEEQSPSFVFTMNVANLRPYYLNLRDDDPEYFASFLINTNMSGKRIDELNGSVELVNSLFRRSGAQVQLYDMMLKTENNTDSSYISLQSDDLNATISGKYNLQELPSLLKGIINDHFELFPGLHNVYDTSTTFSLQAELNDTEKITDFFFPEFNLTSGSNIRGDFHAEQNNYRFSCTSSFPNFGFKGTSWNSMNVSILSDTNNLSIRFSGDMFATEGGFEIKQPEIDMTFANDTSDLAIRWNNNAQPLYSGNIETQGQIFQHADGNTGYSMVIHPSWFFYNNKKFTIPKSELYLNSEEVSIDSFYIKGERQFFLVDGKVTENPEDSITFSVQNFNLHMFNDIYYDMPIELKGILSGHTSLKKEFGNPVLASNLNASNLEINNQLFGNTLIRADWIRSKKEIELQLLSASNQINHIDIKGFFKPNDQSITFDFRLNDMDLIVLEPFTNNFLDDITGTGDLNLNLSGTIKDPIIDGEIDFRNTSVLVKETQTRYYFSDNLRIQNNNLFFDRFKVTDDYGNSLFADGNITTSRFDDLFINVDLTANNFNFLSTSRFDNEQFYGDIYASGIIHVSGPPKQLKIKANANTEEQTNLKLPLYNPAEIQTTDFITFTRNEETDQPIFKPEPQRKSRMALDMELEINSSASVQLIFDPKVGDIIQASGNGTLKFEIDENGDFSMFGNVLITDGEYLFTLQNVINKRFRVKPGGRISWNGSPKSAVIDLQAVYETKASTYNLAPIPTEEMKKRIPVHCLLTLQGELENPTIKPQINLPTAEPETKSLVETSIGTDEELMRQFISLLVINNFISSADFAGNSIGGTSSEVAGVTASELLSNQLSNWLSQISNDFDIGVNYRPGDAISSDEVEFALSTQLLNDRIIFTGNLDVLADEVKTPGGEASNIVGDFDLEFRVTDKISLKAFNRVNDDRIVRPSLYTQGVGVIYRNEFNSISDLFKNKDGEKNEDSDEQIPDDDAMIREEDTEDNPL